MTYSRFLFPMKHNLAFILEPDVESLQAQSNQEQKACPWWVESIPLIALVIADVLVCEYFIDKDRVQWRYPIYAKCFGALCLAWFVFLVATRVICSGLGCVYDAYWFCNICLILTGLGVFLSLPSLIGQSVCLLLMPHATFWIDFLFYPCCKRCVLGAYPYMFDKATPVSEKITSYHHFWYFPGLCILLIGCPPFSIASFVLSVVLFSIMIVLARWMTPLDYTNSDGSKRYLNICLAYEYPEFGRTLFPFKYAIGKGFTIYVLTLIFAYIVPVNFISYLLVYWLQRGVNALLGL